MPVVLAATFSEAKDLKVFFSKYIITKGEGVLHEIRQVKDFILDIKLSLTYSIAFCVTFQQTVFLKYKQELRNMYNC